MSDTTAVAALARSLASMPADDWKRREAPAGLDALDPDADDATLARQLLDDDALCGWHFTLLAAAEADCAALFRHRVSTLGREHAGSTLNGKPNPLEFFAVQAAIVGSARVLQALVEAGIDTGWVHEDGQNDHTALHWAAYGRHEDAVAALLAAPDVRLDVLDRRRTTALACALRRGGAPVARRLLEAGADPNDAGPGSASPLALAIGAGDPELVEVVLGAGAEVDLHDNKSGLTALQLAIVARRTDLVQLLLEHGADAAVPSRRAFKKSGVKLPGKSTALQFAEQVADPDVLGALGR